MKKNKSVKQFLSDNWIALIPYVMLLIIIVVMGVLNSNTLNSNYLANKCDASLSLILVAIGQTFVLITGGFDLSVGGIICIVNCLMATRMTDSVGSMILWSVIGILIGILIGCFNGFVIERTGLQPFIVTLATQSVCMGTALLILKVDGGNVPITYMKAMLTRFGAIPISLIILIALLLIWIYFKKTKICMNIYAVGSNKKAANLNGVNVLKTTVVAYGRYLSNGFRISGCNWRRFTNRRKWKLYWYHGGMFCNCNIRGISCSNELLSGCAKNSIWRGAVICSTDIK